MNAAFYIYIYSFISGHGKARKAKQRDIKGAKGRARRREFSAYLVVSTAVPLCGVKLIERDRVTQIVK